MKPRAGRAPCSRLPRAGVIPMVRPVVAACPATVAPRRRGAVPVPSAGWQPAGRPALCAVERPLRPARERGPSCTRSARRDIGVPRDGDDRSCRRLITVMSWVGGRFRIPSMPGRRCRIRWAGRTKEEGVRRPSRWPRDGGRGSWMARMECRGGGRTPPAPSAGPTAVMVAACRSPCHRGSAMTHRCLRLPRKQGDRSGGPLHAVRGVRHTSVGRVSCERHKTHM